jgi:hypothetical protein
VSGSSLDTRGGRTTMSAHTDYGLTVTITTA